jgi:hypothetical protein
MAHPLNDLTGQRFGRLVVIERGESYVNTTLRPFGKPTTHKVTRWVCQCDCGNIVEVTRNNLISGASTSCGCKRKEKMSEIAKARWR